MKKSKERILQEIKDFRRKGFDKNEFYQFLVAEEERKETWLSVSPQDSKKIFLTELILAEMGYFESERMKNEFFDVSVEPYFIEENWLYGNETHQCWVVAKNDTEQIVYCQTGFGPSFLWSLQPLNEKALGMDAQWNAYLVETFTLSNMWVEEVPDNFTLMGPGERVPHNY